MRAAGKKLIGAQASSAIWDGVDEWLRRNPRKSVTDFVIEASMEKLVREKIPFDQAAALFDGRRRVPASSSAKAIQSPHVLDILNKTGKKKSGGVSSRRAA